MIKPIHVGVVVQHWAVTGDTKRGIHNEPLYRLVCTICNRSTFMSADVIDRIGKTDATTTCNCAQAYEPSQRLGRLTVIGISHRTLNGNRYLVECDCGKRLVASHMLLSHRTMPLRNCGCMNVRANDKFGHLVVIGRTDVSMFSISKTPCRKASKMAVQFVCRCEYPTSSTLTCGEILTVDAVDLVYNAMSRCGSHPADVGRIIMDRQKSMPERMTDR